MTEWEEKILDELREGLSYQGQLEIIKREIKEALNEYEEYVEGWINFNPIDDIKKSRGI